LILIVVPLTDITTSISWFFSTEGFLLTVSITLQLVSFLLTWYRFSLEHGTGLVSLDILVHSEHGIAAGQLPANLAPV